MSDTSYSILGSSVINEILADCSDARIKSSAIGANPLFLTEGEKEALAADKGDWLIIDSSCLGCDVGSVDSVSSEIESLAKFIKKNWGRKVMFISTRPSAFCARGGAVQTISGYKPRTLAAEVGSKLVDSLNCYIISLPFECISQDGKPYNYIPRILEYIRSVIGVISVKCDRNAIDKLSLACSIDVGRMLGSCSAGKESDSDKEALRSAYLEAASEGKKAKACAICADLVSKGDMWAAPLAEKCFAAANKACNDDSVKIGWLRKFADSGMDWAKPVLFDHLWKLKTPEADAEMVEAVRGMAERDDGAAIKRLIRAYREGRGVDKDLDKALELSRKNYKSKIPGSNLDLFDTLWKVGTPEAYEEMVSIVEKPASEGDVGSMVRMARAYREGKGAEKDVEKAVSILEKVASEKPAFRKELENTRKLL